MSYFHRLGEGKTCDLDDLARVLGKQDAGAQTKLKAIRRKFIGLRPLGEEGVDYRVAAATKNHVKDNVARDVGFPIFTFVKGRTKFDTVEVIDFLITQRKMDEIVAQIRKELGRKPTRQEVATEIGLDESRVGMFF